MTATRYTRWLDPDCSAPGKDLIDLAGGSLAAQILLSRGLRTQEQALPYLFPDLYDPHSPCEMPGMEAAAGLVLRAARDGRQICVWGDFDVDGQTSTTILVSALRKLGADVRHVIPVRSVDSHGVHLEKVQQLAAQGVGLLLTCDTGISAHPAVEWARDHGLEVVITDHHELPERLPRADAVLNPHFLPPAHALAPLPGCGVAFMLAQELYAQGGLGDPTELLDLTALGIVADSAALRGECRFLLQRGLDILRQAQRVGLQHLYRRAGITDPGHITEETISFTIAPRLNSLGRLSDANGIVDFLTTDSASQAAFFTDTLEELNLRRRLMTAQILNAALDLVQADPSLLDHPVLVLSHPKWEGGVIGIVASRLVERFGRPVVLLREGEDGSARGSARSVPGVDIFRAITRLKDMLGNSGGHAMAAGLSLPLDRIAEFRVLLGKAVLEQGDLPEPVLQIDAAVPLEQVDTTLVQQLELLAPYGVGNPAPVFSSPGLQLAGVRKMGADGEHQLIQVVDSAGRKFELLRWNGSSEPLPSGRVELAYTPRASTYRGEAQIQLEWVDSRASPGTPAVLELRDTCLPIEDRRVEGGQASRREDAVPEDAAVWLEGSAGRTGQDRQHLDRAQTLVIAFPPPGPQEIRKVLERVQPARVVLLAGPGPDDSPQAFIRSLMQALAPLVSQAESQVDREILAAQTGQRVESIRWGLEFLAASGRLDLSPGPAATWSIRVPALPRERAADKQAAEQMLRRFLSETAAFREYFATAPVGTLQADFFQTLPPARTRRPRGSALEG